MEEERGEVHVLRLHAPFPVLSPLFGRLGGPLAAREVVREKEEEEEHDVFLLPSGKWGVDGWLNRW